jgi:hypothetical protein
MYPFAHPQEGTWVWGGFPEKLDEGRPFASRQMRPCPQDGLKDEEGSVLVGGLGDTGDAWHRGKVEAFGGRSNYTLKHYAIYAYSVSQPRLRIQKRMPFVSASIRSSER